MKSTDICMYCRRLVYRRSLVGLKSGVKPETYSCGENGKHYAVYPGAKPSKKSELYDLVQSLVCWPLPPIDMVTTNYLKQVMRNADLDDIPGHRG